MSAVAVGSVALAAAMMSAADHSFLAAASANANAWAQITFLVLHPAILEPNFHLFLGQLQFIGNFDAPQPRQVLAHGELTFQIEQLLAGECGTNAFAGITVIRYGGWWRRWRREFLFFHRRLVIVTDDGRR